MNLLIRLIAVLTAALRPAIAAPVGYAFLEDQAGGELSVRATLTTPKGWPPEAAAELVFHYQDEADYLVARLRRQGLGFFRAHGGKESKWGDLVDWKPPAGKSLQVTLQRRDCHIALAVDGKHSLRIQTRVSGGDFRAWAGVKRFDPTKFPEVAFSYRIDSNVKVNLRARVGDRWFGWLLTGGDVGPGVTSLGQIEGVAVDGDWHAADLPLLDTLTWRPARRGLCATI